MIRPGLQLTPPSVVFEKSTGPLNAGEKVNAVGLALVLGETRRSQTAYAVVALIGSAVTDSLSFSTVVEVSTCAVTGVCQVRPPSVERLMMIALVPPKAGPFALNESLIE